MAPPPADYSLYYVTGRPFLPAGMDFFDNLEQACQGGCTIVQLREKDITTKEFLSIATRSKEICDRYKIPLLINDRLDIALAVKCGLHIGQDDFPAILARQMLGPDYLLGVSTNTEDEIRAVMADGVADYIGIGPVVFTASKKNLCPLLGTRGISKLLGVLDHSHIKAVAIGGISATTLPNVLRQCSYPRADGTYRPLDGVAVISAIASSPDPLAATKHLRSLIDAAPTYPVVSAKSAGSVESVIEAAGVLLARLREDRNPVIHHITNGVVMNDTANLTLALGGSPIMSASSEEAPELGLIIGALLLNMGTLNVGQVAAQMEAGKCANRNEKPVVFDPVGVGATKFRRENADELLSAIHMSIIKGNAGEIGALVGSDEVQARGVDSVGSGFKDPAGVISRLAQREKLVIAMSGEIDYISDGNFTFAIDNGHHYQSVITGSGCMASTAVATFASIAGEHGNLVAAVAGLLAINVAAEIAAARPDVKGPNTFRAALIDECYNLTPEILKSKARLRLL